jgi:hypothetical protein
MLRGVFVEREASHARRSPGVVRCLSFANWEPALLALMSSDNEMEHPSGARVKSRFRFVCNCRRAGYGADAGGNALM